MTTILSLVESYASSAVAGSFIMLAQRFIQIYEFLQEMYIKDGEVDTKSNCELDGSRARYGSDTGVVICVLL